MIDECTQTPRRDCNKMFINFERAQTSLEPVSYTHLDVYKRQV